MRNLYSNINLRSVLGNKTDSNFYNVLFKTEAKIPVKRWDNLKTPNENDIYSLNALPEITKKEKKNVLSKLVLCKLNGGLGTTMGCSGPKSLIEIRENQTFMDMVIKQVIHINEHTGENIPLLLMNSFHTDKDTHDFLSQFDNQISFKTFCQNKFKRLRRDNMLPIKKQDFGDEVSYPPGHGDFYPCLYETGILEQLIESGKEYIFISNIDNLGAVIDERIPRFMKKHGITFLCEVADKTRNDLKGGIFIENPDKSISLLEISQIPQENRNIFEDIKQFNVFNTNNLWINLKELKKLMDTNCLTVDPVFNNKQINGIGIVQVETLIASAVRSFKNSGLLKVDRTRFIPVKKTEDLFLLKSSLFSEEDGILTLNNKRQFKNFPFVRLGDYYHTVNELLIRIPHMPDITDLDMLTIIGNVHFGRNVKLAANVIINCTGDVLHIPDNTVLTNKVINGSLQMSEL